MDTIISRTDGKTLTIAISGRIDASNAPAVETQIFTILEAHPGQTVVLDADALEYISSAGLRVVLRIRKAHADLSIINVSQEVYEIFDMTGFTDMVRVEKAFRRMSVEGCEFIAKGANGAVYRYDDETILKTYHNPDALDEIRQERENARKAFVLGVNTAIPYGIVRVGQGYGTVTELLNAQPVSKLIAASPDDLSESAGYYVGLLKSIHATNLQEGDVPDMRQTALAWADFVAPKLTPANAQKLRSLVEAVPFSTTMLHGDYHTNNVMVQNGEPLLIDMDTLCMGHPVFELGSMFNGFVGYAEVNPPQSDSFLGYPFPVACRFWKLALSQYLDTQEEARITEVEDKAKVIGYTRMLRRAMRRPNEADSATRIARCQEVLEELLPRVETLLF